MESGNDLLCLPLGLVGADYDDGDNDLESDRIVVGVVCPMFVVPLKGPMEG